MDLISIPSVNPAFCTDDSLSGEARVAEMLSVHGAKLGFDFTFQLVKGKRKNLLLKYKPCSRPRHRLLLAPHMDTVVADVTQLNPIIKNGRIYGRGACDTKGSIAAMLDALAQVINKPAAPQTYGNTFSLFSG
jgi:acetylornithine deacetylase/succinyl-diaminopimelate desuccinylase-like protein